MDNNISVALRVRPLSSKEIESGCQSCIDCVPNEPQVVLRNTDKSFTYNYVFNPESSNSVLYNTAVKTLVPKLFEGYNVTILAYGQTGSGKTHSMGMCNNGEGETGIIPRAVIDIFEKIRASEYEFKVSTSFIELYKEQLFDLLACSTKNKPKDKCIVEIRGGNDSGISIPGLVEIEVKCVEDSLNSLMMGSAIRATGATAMNAKSSRSHAIFTVTIQMCKRDNGNGGREMVSKFHLVDLAGSESVRKTGATGERLKEGTEINKGLLALGNVISTLSVEAGFVNYRESKLTRILKDSLGGNSITLMVACVSPADDKLVETLSTLHYAYRTRGIKNKPIINKVSKAAEMMHLKKENNLGNRGKKGTCPKEQDLSNENDKLKAENRTLKEALNNALERALLAELARDRMNIKIKELTDQCNMTIDQFDLSQGNSPITQGNLASLRDIQSKIVELQAELQHGEEEIKKHELHELSSCKSGLQTAADSSGAATTFTVQSEEFDRQEEHTLHLAELNNEPQELTRALAVKENLAATLLSNSSNMSTLNPENVENMKQLESQIDAVHQERDALQQQLKSVQSNNASDEDDDSESDMENPQKEADASHLALEALSREMNTGDPGNAAAVEAELVEAGTRSQENQDVAPVAVSTSYAAKRITEWRCKECGKFRHVSKNNVKDHVKSVHLLQKAFMCKYCGTRFALKRYITIHCSSKSHIQKCVELGVDPVADYIEEDNKLRKEADMEAESRIEQVLKK